MGKRSEKADLDLQYEGMVFIPMGEFEMGSQGYGEFEQPVHQVHVTDFWVDEVPVTNAQFARFAQDSGYRTHAERTGYAWGYNAGHFAEMPGLSWRTFSSRERHDHPVVMVTWDDAAAFCTWARKRLPTEAEWEKAARGGLRDSLYPWGEQTPNGTQSNFARRPAEIPPTTPVRQFPPNAYGLYDVVGNVWQWCQDWYSAESYARPNPGEPLDPEQGRTRCRRGGSWNVIQPFRLRCANRGAAPPTIVATNIGFRCVRSSR